MRLKPLIMIILAVVFGGSAILVGNSWLQRQAERNRPVAAAPSDGAARHHRGRGEPAPVRRRGRPRQAARDPLAGRRASGRRLRDPRRGRPRRTPPGARGDRAERARPARQADRRGPARDAVGAPVGRHGRGDDRGRRGDRPRRVRAAGRPGRCAPDPGRAEGGGGLHNDRILHNVRVVAVGQTADEKTDKPTVVRAVTVEVDTRGAQKVALASRARALSPWSCARPARPLPGRRAASPPARSPRARPRRATAPAFT